MSELIIGAGLILVLSIASFLLSVSRKKMGLLYLALLLFGLAVLVAGITLYRFMRAEL